MESTPFSPSRLILAAVMLGAGLYLIQRGRFLVPAMMARNSFLRARPRLARALVMVLLLLGIMLGGMGCRVLVAWFF